MKKLKVAVIMGGRSSEREVSLKSGEEVFRKLNKEKYLVSKYVIPEELEKIASDTDVAVLALHGKGGEDGVIQGYFETRGIKYTGCGVLASALGMNKRLFKDLMLLNGVRMPKDSLSVPCVVKPSNGGSSIGVSIVRKESELGKAIEEAKKYDEEVIVEEYIEGIEVSCGVLGNKEVVALPIIEIVPKGSDFFDYEAKYVKGFCEEICPARLDEKVSGEIKKIAVEVFKKIGGRGYARVDFIVDSKMVPYLLEINTLPGMTETSLMPQEAMAEGISYPELLDKMIELALER